MGQLSTPTKYRHLLLIGQTVNGDLLAEARVGVQLRWLQGFVMRELGFLG
jgi:hypothetical protein